MQRRLVVLPIMAGLLFASAPASADCRWGGARWSLASEGPWTQSLTTDPGRSCRRTFSYNGPVVFRRLNLLEAPTNGTVSLREGGYMTYTPKPSYRGADQYLIQICGEAGRGLECAKIEYRVTVR